MGNINKVNLEYLFRALRPFSDLGEAPFESAKGKSIDQFTQILKKYNPPSIVPNYAKKVMNVMKEIGPDEIVTVST